MFCSPADKNQEAIGSASSHLACYFMEAGVDPVTGAVQELLAVGTIDVVNQFNPNGPLEIGAPFAFCAPSTISLPEPSALLGLVSGILMLRSVDRHRRRRSARRA